MEKLIAIIGPTAVGKTQVSLAIAHHLKTRIISGDSMLVYRGLNIGTAKPTAIEQAKIPHYLIDIREPDEEFSVADFQRLASGYITQVNSLGKIPVIAGGTGLYIKALLEGYQLTSPSADAYLRNQLQQLAEEHGNEHIYQMLAKIDPLKAASLHPNDVRRIIRALEIRMLSPQSTVNDVAAKPLYDSLVIGLTMERELLYERINQRVDIMLDNGLADEVKQLVDQGIPLSSQSMQAIGYKEMVGYIHGKYSMEAAAAAIKQATRRFAKRQMTWYRKMHYINWIKVDSFPSQQAMMEHIYNLVAEKFGLE